MGKLEGKPLLFVLDHMEEFATEARQTFLYSLFDLSHREDLRVVVVGITSHLNFRSLLEKRVQV